MGNAAREGGGECSAIAGATSSSYTLVGADARAAVRVRVTASAGPSAGTPAVSPALAVSPDALLDRSRPFASGVDHEGQTLSVEPGIWTGAEAISSSEQWQRCDEAGDDCASVEGADASAYALGAGDVGHAVRVLETASTTNETASEPSPATPAIGSEPTAPTEVLEPTTEGPATAGRALSAAPGTWAGSEPIAYAYRWERCAESGEECADIEGATSSSYTLTEADVGSTVRVAVTATNAAGATTASSSPSELVGAPGPPENEAAPEIDGLAREGQQLAGDDGSWRGSRPLAYARRWERCDASGEECAAITGATGATYTPTDADTGHTLRLYVTASNALASATVRSAPTTPVGGAAQASTNEAVAGIDESDPSLLAPAETAQVEGEAVKPASEDEGEELTSSGAPTGATMSKQTAGELAVETPAGEIALEPTDISPSASGLPAIVNGTAAVYPETETATDTVIRPDALGATTLTQLRSPSAPSSFSWELNLTEHEELRQLADGAIAVVELPEEDELEAPLGEAIEEHEQPGEASEAGEEAPPGEEGAEGGEEPSTLEPPAPAPTISTPPFEPRSNELHPQETASVYEADASELARAEAEADPPVLMVIDPPQALDADGQPVPASLALEGDTITLHLSLPEHAAYPVTAAVHVASRGGKHQASRAPEYGLSDDLYQDFAESEEHGETVPHFDTRLTRTGAKQAPLHTVSARLVLWWKTPPGTPELLEWLREVKKAKLKPFIVLASCEQGTLPSVSCSSAGEPNPAHTATSVREYGKAFKALFESLRKLYTGPLGQYPAVTSWGAWNEPDREAPGASISKINGGPELAAYLWQEARAVVYDARCHDCRVVAGEFYDYRAREGYANAYVNTILHKPRYWRHDKPKTWGTHDYGDVVRGYTHRGDSIADAFLQHTPWGELGKGLHVWMTEGGVHLVPKEGNFASECYAKSSGYSNPLKGACLNQELDAKAFLGLHDVTGRHGVHFERLYYYQYRAPQRPSGPETSKFAEHEFDSALLEPAGVKEPDSWRPAYCVLAFHDEKCPPKAKTVSAKPTNSGALVNLTVTTYGSLARYWVQYGTTTAYGQSSEAAPVQDEAGEQAETVQLKDLKPCTTYHLQAEAENEPGEGEPSAGGDQTVTTPCSTLTWYAGGGFFEEGLGDGGPAVGADLYEIGGLAVAPDGTLYIAEDGQNVIRSVTDGIIEDAAGIPVGEDFGYVDGPADEAKFAYPEGLALAPDGALYIADAANQVVRALSDGNVSTFAGTRPQGNYEGRECHRHREKLYSGDGGPASDAGFGEPVDVAVGPEGSLYISDPGDEVVRRVAPNGTISTVAGYYDSAYEQQVEYEILFGPRCKYETYNPTGGYSGDGGPATAATLDGPSAVVVAGNGTLYIAESKNNVVREVSPQGTIGTFAGTGVPGYSGDGGPARDARLESPEGLAIGPEGSVFISEPCNGVVRRVSPDGTITTVAGDGYRGETQYGGPPTGTSLTRNGAIAVNSEGSLFVATQEGEEVAEASAPLGPGSTEDRGGRLCRPYEGPISGGG